MNTPEYWNELKSPAPEYMRVWRNRGLQTLISKSITKDTRWWWHVSVSRPDRMPTWQELAKVRKDFFGEEIEFYQVLPKRSEYVNVHQFCLHMWAPMDGKRCVANLTDLIGEKAP